MAAIVANCAISLNCELTQPVKVQYIDGNMFSMDNAGNTAHVYVFYNGEPQEIVGSVSADVIRSDGTTVAITGAMSGNRAYVIFPQSCYAVPGVVSVVIKVTEGSTVTTIAAFVANVYRSSTDTIVDPGTIIPSVQNLISAIETAVASIPADYSSLWESLAPDYTDITFPVTAGKYCTYNGTLYIAKVDIATTESFTAAHWQSTNIGDNLSALKSAITTITGNEIIQFSDPELKQYIDTNGTTVSWDTPSVSATKNIKWAVVNCSAGDQFTINGKGGGTDRLWAFADQSKNILEKSSANATGMNLLITAPANTAYLIINDESDKISYVGKLVKDSISYVDSVIKNDLRYGKLKPELIPNKYWNYNGNLVAYNGWSATDPISCGNASILYIKSTVKSTYNIWFNGAEGGSSQLVGVFTLEVGDNIIEVIEGATHFSLSNTTAGMESTVITILPTYDDYMKLKADVVENANAIEAIEEGGMAEKTSIIYLNPKFSVGQNIIASHKKLNPWTITPRPTVQDAISFGVITDLHGSATELERFIQYCSEYSLYLNGGLISLGDMVTNIYSNDFTFWTNMTGADAIMLTIGNHDVWLTNSVSSELAPKADAYAKYFAPKIATWGVGITQPQDASTNGLMYYYKDYSDNKLRVIVLDCMYWDSAENTWFVNALNGAYSSGYDVLAIEHYNPSKNLTAMDGNFYSLDYGFSNLVPGTASAQMVQAVENFISGGGSFVGWLSGDAHYDAFGVYEHNSIKQASFTFEAGGHGAGWGDAERVVGQKSQDSFNIVTVDTYSKLIKIVRVGNDCDRFLRHKRYLTYDYANHEVITFD